MKSALIGQNKTYMIKMFDNIPGQPIFGFNKYFNNFVEVVWTDAKDFNYPRKSPDGEI